MVLNKTYDAKAIEKKWQEFWDKDKIYKFDFKSKKPVFSIDVPPPYASAGHLHIGHTLHYTQFELIARYKRMRGFNVYFAPCFDDNGLPVEKYVEEKFKISKKDITRAKFRKLCLEESKKVEKLYADKVFKAMGHCYDWDLLYTTIGPRAQKITQLSFLELYKKGEVYRAEEPTLWCPYHQTSLAQAELESKERETKLNYLYFDLENGEKIEIATTRPEFLAACVGIFVHPKDDRYKNLVGKKAIVPIYGHKVPIMKDADVDMKFGSGIAMICTFGDTGDILWWKKHKLPLRVIMTEDGLLNENGGEYEGLALNRARERIIERLKKEKKLIKQEKLVQGVNCCWRCGTAIEYLVTKQWFIKALKHKKELLKQGGKINWYPEFYRIRYEDWVKNLGWDWCISRQRFYGVPMPIWYCTDCGNPILADSKSLPIDPTVTKPKSKCKCGSKNFVPEEDVFDTWMTSSMTPQLALGWLKNKTFYKKSFPTSLRPQSHDIIRTWAFYTILKSYLHFKDIPWKDIAIGTFVLDPQGKRMHKSKGNAVWSHEVLDKYSVDVVRHWVGNANLGDDLLYNEKEMIAGQRFLTKLWNASRFSIDMLKDYKSKKVKLTAFDSWLLIKLNKLIEKVTKSYDIYGTSEAVKSIGKFFWNDFCDNYLEIVKDRLYNPDKRGENGKLSGQYTLYNALLSILKMMAPIVPHITEEIYQDYFLKNEKDKSIHISEWPEKFKVDSKTEKMGDYCIDVISKVRQFKTKHKKSLKEPVVLTLDKKHEEELKDFILDLKAVCKAKEIKFGTKFKVQW